MSKYFLDTEFIEGTQSRVPFITKLFKQKPTIDLISIGIVAEDGREYYAISKDFNLKEAWNRWQYTGDKKPTIKSKYRRKGFTYMAIPTLKVEYWIRENVLKPIELELFKLHCKANVGHKHIEGKGDYKSFKWLLETYGKTNKQIAEEVKEFVSYKSEEHKTSCCLAFDSVIKPEFYGYYCDYDWVVFCWLFGRMIDLPTGFPEYCKDLKQILDDKVNELYDESGLNRELLLDGLKDKPNYPKQTNEHNALEDAKWNKELYNFLKQI